MLITKVDLQGCKIPEVVQKIDEIINQDSDEDDLYIEDLQHNSHRTNKQYNKTNSLNNDLNTQQNLFLNNYQNFFYINMQNFYFSKSQTCNIRNVQIFGSFNIPFS